MKAINEVVRKLETVANGDRQLEVRKIRQHRSEYGSHTTYQDLDKALNAYELGEIDKSELRLVAFTTLLRSLVQSRGSGLKGSSLMNTSQEVMNPLM